MFDVKVSFTSPVSRLIRWYSGFSLSRTRKGPTNLFEIEKVRDRENYRKNQNFTNKAREFKFKCSEDFFVEKF